MTRAEAITLVRKIKYASYTDAVRIMKELEIKPKEEKPKYEFIMETSK